MMRSLIIFITLLFPVSLFALQPVAMDQAFQFSAVAKNNRTIVGIWKIKTGYYLYQNRIVFSPVNSLQDRLGPPDWPVSRQMKNHPDFGDMPVYTGHLEIPVPILHRQGDTMTVRVYYQGCAEAGFCYPPTSKTVTINLTPLAIDIAPSLAIPQGIADNQVVAAPPQNQTAQLLAQHNLWAILTGFFVFGLLLSLTPCVLPMIPILSSIIVGQKNKRARHTFALSCTYVLGMAITYAIAGILFGYIGGTAQAALQKPWIIVLFSLIFVLMALSLFGCYTIQLPQSWQNKLSHLSNRQKSGTYFGTALMGCLATLILSPCVTPPLVGVLSYIGHSGSAALGGMALFMMGIGMGVPLLVIGAFSAKLLPKAGPWMNSIKIFLGVLMLGMTILLLSRILPDIITLVLWILLLIGVGIALGTLTTAKKSIAITKKVMGLILCVYGVMLGISAISGNTNPLKPWPFHHASQKTTAKAPLNFITVKSLADVNAQLQLAKAQHQFVMLDFYADWCISCKQMDRSTFANPEVQQRLASFRHLRADITANDAADQALMKAFQVIAPPTVLFFNPNDQEIAQSRIVGEMSANAFLTHISKMLQKT